MSTKRSPSLFTNNAKVNIPANKNRQPIKKGSFRFVPMNTASPSDSNVAPRVRWLERAPIMVPCFSGLSLIEIYTAMLGVINAIFPAINGKNTRE